MVTIVICERRQTVNIASLDLYSQPKQPFTNKVQLANKMFAVAENNQQSERTNFSDCPFPNINYYQTNKIMSMEIFVPIVK